MPALMTASTSGPTTTGSRPALRLMLEMALSSRHSLSTSSSRAISAKAARMAGSATSGVDTTLMRKIVPINGRLRLM
jgi:hypothetical protein